MGTITKQSDGRYNSQTHATSIRAEIDILLNTHKAADAIIDSRVVTQGIEIGAGRTRKGETSGKDYVSLSIAAPEFGPKKLYANLDKVAGADESKLSTVIWNLGD
ncbi:MAG: DUF736 family protein [Fimbriimonadaceae bacterium]|nr:DUF736 family protein [Alphaproteobacteria bacterium]